MSRLALQPPSAPAGALDAAAANAVREAAPPSIGIRTRPGPVIGIGYTPWAQASRYRWRTLYGPPVDQAMRHVLTDVGRAPGQARAHAQAGGDVALLIRVADDAPAELEPGQLRPACFLAGLTAAEINAALDQLAQEGWTP